MTNLVRRHSHFLVIAIFLFGLPVDFAVAQLFGNRSMGQPLQPVQPLRGSGSIDAPPNNVFPNNGLPPFGFPQPQPGPQAGSNTGAGVRGSERFLRNSRTPNAFVGSDRRDQAGFVGSQQAIGTGRVPAATESLRELGSQKGRTNPSLPALSKKGMYYPRLQFDEDLPQPTVPKAMTLRHAKLQEHVTELTQSKASISIEGAEAILRGKVASQKLAQQLEILASFEPGIDRVRNELVVE